MSTNLVATEEQRSKVNVRSSKEFGSKRIQNNHQNYPANGELNHKNYIHENSCTPLEGSGNATKRDMDFFDLKLHKKPTDSVKPLTTSTEPSHYTEFTTKLDYLVEKVMDLAKSSGNIDQKNSDTMEDLMRKTSNLAEALESFDEDRVLEPSNFAQNKYSEVFNLETNHTNNKLAFSKSSNCDKDNASKVDLQYLTFKAENKNSAVMNPKVPPIMNNSIKYVKVSSRSATGSEYSICSKKHLEPVVVERRTAVRGANRNVNRNSLRFEKYISDENESLKFHTHMTPIGKMDTGQETFRVLISGHLIKETPVFILHKNYKESNILIKDPPDFRAHKRKGNVDITLTGKFFCDNILIGNDKGRPAALDLRSHRLLIDRRSAVSHDRFRQVFKLGLYDAILEGEFVENSETCQFIPLFSLEVVKNKPSENLNRATSVIQTEKNNLMSSSKDKTKEYLTDDQEKTKKLYSQQEQSVFYTTTLQEKAPYKELASKNLKPKKTDNKSKESKLTKLKDSICVFLRNKNRSSDSRKITHNDSANEKFMKKETSTKKNEETKLEEDVQPKEEGTVETSDENRKKDPLLSPKKVHTEEKAAEKKHTKKKIRGRSKIVENPGVAQMQGFFFQT